MLDWPLAVRLLHRGANTMSSHLISLLFFRQLQINEYHNKGDNVAQTLEWFTALHQSF